MDNNRKGLLKVPTKDNSNATKRLVGVTYVSERVVHCLYNMPMLHWGLIPDNQVCGVNQVCQI